MHIFHPYQVVQRIRFFLQTEKYDEAEKEVDALMKEYPLDYYIRYMYAKVKISQGKVKEARKTLEKLLEEVPNYYYANIELVKCLMKEEEYSKAKEIVIELHKKYSQNESLELLHEINEQLIRQYIEKDHLSILTEEARIDLAWCLYQNERYEEAKANLERISKDKQKEYEYINLNGRVDLALGYYDTALHKCKLLLEELLRIKNEIGDENFYKEYHTLGYAYYTIGVCFVELGKFDEAISYFWKSVENEENQVNKIQSKLMIADTYFKMENYDECITISEKIMEEDKHCYPAFIYNLKACYMLGLDQNVINLYYEAIRIYGEDLTPYLYAIKVFIRHNQFDDAQEIVKVLQEKKLTNHEVELLKIKILRNTTKNPKELKKTLKTCIELKNSLLERESDSKDIAEVNYEICLLYWDMNNLGKALETIDEAIKLIPSNINFLRAKAYLYKDLEKGEDAFSIFQELYTRDSKDYRALYEIAEYYRKERKVDEALKNYIKVDKLMPDYSDVLERISDIYLDKYEKEEDSKYFNLAIGYADKMVLHNENSYTLNLRGQIYMKAYEFNKALDDFYKALGYDEDDTDIMDNIGYVYRIQRKLDRAYSVLKRSKKLMSRPGACYLAECYRIEGNYDKAIEIYKDLLKKDPEDLTAYEGLAESYKMKGDYVNSIKYQEKIPEILDFSIFKAIAYRKIGLLYYLLNDIKQANEYYKKAIKNDNMDIESYYAYAKFLLAIREYKKAEKVILKLTKLHFDDYKMVNVYEIIAGVIREVAWIKKQEGVKSWKETLEESKIWACKALEYIHKIYNNENEYYSFKPTRKENLISLSYIYLYMGNDAMAEKVIRKAFHCSLCKECIHEDCYDAYAVLGLIKEEQGNFDEAYENFQKCLNIYPCNIFIKKHYEYVKETLNVND